MVQSVVYILMHENNFMTVKCFRAAKSSLIFFTYFVATRIIIQTCDHHNRASVMFFHSANIQTYLQQSNTLLLCLH